MMESEIKCLGEDSDGARYFEISTMKSVEAIAVLASTGLQIEVVTPSNKHLFVIKLAQHESQQETEVVGADGESYGWNSEKLFVDKAVSKNQQRIIGSHIPAQASDDALIKESLHLTSRKQNEFGAIKIYKNNYCRIVFNTDSNIEHRYRVIAFSLALQLIATEANWEVENLPKLCSDDIFSAETSQHMSGLLSTTGSSTSIALLEKSSGSGTNLESEEVNTYAEDERDDDRETDSYEEPTQKSVQKKRKRKTQLKHCLVCEEFKNLRGKNFGLDICNADTQFFIEYRSLNSAAEERLQLCDTMTCSYNKKSKRWLCTYCHFKKCIDVGMRGFGEPAGPNWWMELVKNQLRKLQKLPEMCVVCGKEAHYANYGVLTCPDCANFFWNKTRTERVSPCFNTNNCPVSGATIPCEKCHFTKCVSVGMKDLSDPDGPFRWFFKSIQGPAYPPERGCGVCNDYMQKKTKKSVVTACTACARFSKDRQAAQGTDICVAKGDCAINPFKKDCKFCRFKKCIEFGMRDKNGSVPECWKTALKLQEESNEKLEAARK